MEEVLAKDHLSLYFTDLTLPSSLFLLLLDLQSFKHSFLARFLLDHSGIVDGILN
jgi:hypothetical protein